MAESITIPVGGMTCAACQARVQRALQRAPGVEDASVNLILGIAAVRFDQGVTDPGQLVEAIEATGYTASLPAAAGSELAQAGARDADQLREYRALRTRAILALAAGAIAMVASIPLMTMASGAASVDPLMHAVMTRVAPSLGRLMPWLFAIPGPLLAGALLLMTIAVMVGAGRHFYIRAWQALRHGGADMNTLIALGTGAAFLYSVVATVAPGLFLSRGLAPDLYDEAVVLIIGFVLAGNALEARATRRTADALRALAALQPELARVERDGALREIPVAEVGRGEIVVVRPGERIAVDGEVLDGESAVNEALLTGEARLVPKRTGERVIGGSVNGDGALRVRATAVGDASTLAGIVRLMRDAQNSRAPVQQLTDRISGIFVPVIVVIALITFVAWALTAADAPMLRGFSAAVAVLIVACPCAMGLAVPTAVMVATGRGAQLGVLIRGGDALQRAGEIDTVIFDKTGTLTGGAPEVVDLICIAGVAADELLGVAAAVERWSEHPLGSAIVRAADARALTLPRTESFRADGGRGASAMIDGALVLVGSHRYLAERGLGLDAIDVAVAARQSSETLVFVARGDRVLGAILLDDTIRPSAVEAVARLKRRGLQVALLSGDRDPVARRVAAVVGIDDVSSELLPAGKVDEIRRRQRAGRRIAMVGDGINDAPALAQADVGIAIGGGAGVAVEAADIALVGGELGAVADAVALSRATLRIIRQNLFWAFAYNVVAVPIAAGVLYPATGLLLSPVIASAAMALSSVSVVTNSLRLRHLRLDSSSFTRGD